MTYQPRLPLPVPLSPFEVAYIDESPPGFWPQNQDSNFGVHRKVFCDQLVNVANQLQLLINESFPGTSTQFLAFWEFMLGLPLAPVGFTLFHRQQIVQSRFIRGPFTHTMLRAVIEPFIIATFGPAISIGVGIPIGAGLPLYSGVSGDVRQYYTIVDSPTNFTYWIFIDSRVTVDSTYFAQELNRINPAGYTYILGTLYNKTGGGVSRGHGGGTHQ